MNIDIVYEDEHTLAVNKPSGLMVHGDGRTKKETLADWVLEKYPNIRTVGEPLILSSGEEILRPGIVHRLDQETSGVLLIAKTDESFSHIKKQFQDRTIEKTYHAFIYGTPKEEEALIDRPIGRSKSNFKLWSAERGARGELREARTRYRVMQKGVNHSFVEVRPETGRTHQIRVHFKSIGHPVLCDSLYAPKRSCELGFTRLALHASTISFFQSEGGRITIETPLPPDFATALDMLKRE